MLVLMLLPAVVAAALVYSRGDSRLRRIRIRAWWLIIPAAALHCMNNEGYYPQSVSAETATRVVTVLSLVLTAVLCWVNWGGRARSVKVGLGLILAGTLSNAIPILVYGGMPYWTSAALTSGVPVRAVRGNDLVRHIEAVARSITGELYDPSAASPVSTTMVAPRADSGASQ